MARKRSSMGLSCNWTLVSMLQPNRKTLACLVFILTVLLIGIAAILLNATFQLNAFSYFDIAPGQVATMSNILSDINATVMLSNTSFVRTLSMPKAYSRRYLNARLRCFSESGRWVYDLTPRHLPWNYVGDVYASTCESRHQWTRPGGVFGDQADDIASGKILGSWSVREELKWRWQTNTSNCPWQSIDRDDFCRRLGSKGNMMVVGDSLNHEISWSFMNALIVVNGSSYGHLSSNDRSIQGPYEMCSDIFSSGQGFKISFVRNDKLSTVVHPVVDTENNFYEFTWINLLRDQHIKTLLLNRGAHYEDDATYRDALRTVFTILSLEYPDVLVIYRNTQPGHMDCMNFTKPLASPQQDFPAHWHWQDFPRQNALAKQIVEDFGHIYMDTYTMLSLRPEGHIYETDCLHYCIPGPLDVVTEFCTISCYCCAIRT